jgi:predicted transcriptional regulator
MTEEQGKTLSQSELCLLTADIVMAFIGNNTISITQLPELISTVHKSVSELQNNNIVQETEPQKPAVSIKNSLDDDYIICLEDGQKMKMLKRHLRTVHNLTPSEYRAKWGLPADYPMVAPNYSKERSKHAKNSGLGRKAKQ